MKAWPPARILCSTKKKKKKKKKKEESRPESLLSRRWAVRRLHAEPTAYILSPHRSCDMVTVNTSITVQPEGCRWHRAVVHSPGVDVHVYTECCKARLVRLLHAAALLITLITL